jgi:hypothetical protein
MARPWCDTPLGFQFWDTYSQTGNHQQEDLAKFGYRAHKEVRFSLKVPFFFGVILNKV